jgi:hypothetical protein
VKAVAVSVDLGENPEPSARIRLGAGVVGRVEAKLAFVRDELDKWRADHDDAVVA